MSIFNTEAFPCPECNEDVSFEVVASVNADRRPDLREAILDESFQRGTCANCEHTFRIEPQMTYFHLARHQWILVQPADDYAQWTQLEAIAQETFDVAYGADASAAAQEIGRDLKVRITFGWPAIREKLLCGEHGLDDVTLELLKLAAMQNLEDLPLSDENELRLNKVDGQELEFYWIETATGRPISSMLIPRSAYNETAEAVGFDELRTRLTSGPFVDMNRLLVSTE